MLPRTNTSDSDMDTSPSSSSKQAEYLYDRNNDGQLLDVVDPFAPIMAPNIQHSDRRSPLHGITAASSFPSPFLHTLDKLQHMLSKSNSPIITLPSEILLFILTHLTVKQLLPLQFVSHKFRQLSRTVLLDMFAGAANNLPNNTHDSATMAASTVNPLIISLYLFPDPHHPPARWHECQTVIFHCTAIDRLQEILFFQPVDPSTATLSIPQHPSFTRSQYQRQQQPWNTGMASRNMAAETDLMRQAVRFCNPAIGLNFFNYSTGQRTRSTPSAMLPMTAPLNPYIHSLGYNTESLSKYDPTIRLSSTRHPFENNDASVDDEYSVIGIKHGGWPTLRSQDFEGGWYHWNMSDWNDYVGGSSQREMDSDEEVMLCLQSEETKGLVGGTTMEKRHEVEMSDTVNDLQPAKVHRHRLLQPQRRHERTSSRFVRYCCLHLSHHDYGKHQHQHRHPKDKEGQEAMFERTEVGDNREGGGTKVGSKDWWIEYRPVPIEAPVCQSCSQQDGHRHHGGGVQVEFQQLRVSLDWILSGFMNEA